MKNSMGGKPEAKKDQFGGHAGLQGWMQNSWMGCWESLRRAGPGSILRLRCWAGVRPGREEITRSPEAKGLTNGKTALSPLR